MYLLAVFGDDQREIKRTFFDILQVFVLGEAFCNADLVLERAVSGTFIYKRACLSRSCDKRKMDI